MFSLYLDDPEAQVSAVKGDDLVLVSSLVQDVTERQERRCVRENGATPRRVALVRDDQRLLMRRDRLVQYRRVVVLIWRREVILRYRDIKGAWFNRYHRSVSG